MQGTMMYTLLDGVVHCAESLKEKFSKEDFNGMDSTDLFDCVNSLLGAMGEMKKLEGGGDNDPFPLSEIERMCKVVRR